MMEMNGLSSTALAAATSVPIVAAAAGLPKENGHSHLHLHHGVETDPLVVSMKLDPMGAGVVQQVHLNQENGVTSVGVSGVGVTTDIVNNVVVGGVNPANAVLSVNAAAAQTQRIAVATTTTGTDSGGGGGLIKQELETTGTATTINNGVCVTPPSTATSIAVGAGVMNIPSASNTTGTATANGAGYENKLFVGGLSWQTSSEKLREYFGKFGQVLEVQVVVDPMTQRSRGFGFITFADADTVRKIVSVPNHILDGKRIDPKHATPRNKQVPAVNAYKTKKIFVGGVSQDTTLDEIKAYFGQFGKVEDAVMLMDQQTMRHRGFGFVTFESDEVVERICEIHYHTIKDKKVECKKAKPKEAQAVVAGVTGLHHAFGHDAAAAAAAAHHLSLATSAAASALGAQRTNPAYAAFYGGHLGLAGAQHQAHHQATSLGNHLAAANLSGGLAGSLGIIPGAGQLGAAMVSAAPGPTYSSIRSGLTRYTPYPVRNYVTGNTAGGVSAPPPPPPPSAAAAAAAQMSQPAILTSLSANPQAASPFAAYHHAAAAHHASMAQNPSASTNAATLDFGISGIPTAIQTAQTNAPSIHPAATFDWSGVYHV